MFNRSMLCEYCGKHEATTKISTEGGSVLLCTACFLKHTMLAEYPEVRQMSVCQGCGTTGEDFAKTAFVGCANCYAALERYIMPYVLKVQPALEHKGKTLSQDAPFSRYNRLKRELKRALDEGRLDDAEQIRAAIAKLKEEGDA